jgi:hypothetical protein
MIRGSWGIGKTALIYTLLDRLAREVFDLDEQMLVLYLDGSPIQTPTDFYRLLLLAIATEMITVESADSTIREEAKEIADRLTGVVSSRRQPILEGKVNLAFFSLGYRESTTSMQVLPGGSSEPYPLLLTWLERAENCFSRLVIAIDDLDKKDFPIVQTILEGSLDLFRTRQPRSFLMTGRGFTDLQEVTLQTLGIFGEDLRLDKMPPEDLRQMTINYLNTVRDSPRNDPHPFTEEAMAQLAEYSRGNPRQLNLIGDKILRQAAVDRCEEIDLNHFQPLWLQLQEQVAQKLTPQLRKLLYLAYEGDGIGENMTNDQLDQLNAVTFSELIPMLKPLEQQGLLMREEDESGFRYLPSKLISPSLFRDATKKFSVHGKNSNG